ncbi:metalloregulator ArsR/SmtB family transcription factor [Patescibacteria group bacterium]
MYQQIFKLQSSLLKAISHPKRLEIIQLLRERELSVSEILDMLGLPQANLSQHLMVLRDAGVVSTRREGKQVYYKLAHKNYVKANDLLREILVKRYKDTGLADEFVLKMDDLVPLVHDPVCDMRLSPKTAGYARKHKANKYYFCAKGCLNTFKKNPEKYAK